MKSLRIVLFFAGILGFSACTGTKGKTADDGGAVEIRRAEPANEFGADDLSTSNDVARFLAGLESRGRSPLGDLRNDPVWRNHASDMDTRWKRCEIRLSEIRSWRRGALGGIGAANHSVFYPFSGPDILHAYSFFPNADDYYLCGLEPVGALPDMRSLTPGQLSLALSGLRTTVSTALDFSYFITLDMREDLQRTPLQGALPVMLAFLARNDHRVISIANVSLGADGVITEGGGNGVRIRCAAPGHTARNVYYFRSDLSDGGNGGFDALMAANKPGVTFVKSASYLMHGGGFSRIRNSIQTHSSAIVEDPSGVPYRYLADGNWDVSLYGNYVRTLEMFSEYYQPDLRAAYQQGGAQPINFGVGYIFDPSETSVIVARRR
jgi:hypothetical protein